MLERPDLVFVTFCPVQLEHLLRQASGLYNKNTEGGGIVKLFCELCIVKLIPTDKINTIYLNNK